MPKRTVTHHPLTGRKLRASEVYVIDDPNSSTEPIKVMTDEQLHEYFMAVDLLVSRLDEYFDEIDPEFEKDTDD